MIDYGNEKLNEIFRNTWPNLGWAKRMTEYQPTPQTPEEVSDGLRDAMIQAKKDGVFDWDSMRIKQPKYICVCDFFGGGQFRIYFMEDHLIPNRWIRFWTRLFFNSKWEYLND